MSGEAYFLKFEDKVIELLETPNFRNEENIVETKALVYVESPVFTQWVISGKEKDVSIIQLKINEKGATYSAKAWNLHSACLVNYETISHGKKEQPSEVCKFLCKNIEMVDDCHDSKYDVRF